VILKPKRFALDEQFPETILESLRLGIREAELIPLRRIDLRLREMDDWELLLSLHHLKEWDGLISEDTQMLFSPRDMAVLHQTKLTVVFIERAGHDPIRAAGLLLVHLPAICAKTVRTMGQVWKLSAQVKNHEDPYDELRRIADHRKVRVKHLYETSKLSKQELARNPLRSDNPRLPGL